jgi:hypothetical protein
MVHCENCDRAYEHADELDHETADEVTLVEDGEKPEIRIGAGKRDVWRCRGCGSVLGVR